MKFLCANSRFSALSNICGRALFLSLFILLSSFVSEAPFPKGLAQRIGEDSLWSILSAKSLSITPLVPRDEARMTKILDIEELEIFKAAILDDSSYNFGWSKMNVFVPEFLIESDRNDILILISLSTAQVEFRWADHIKRIELSPLFMSKKLLEKQYRRN